MHFTETKTQIGAVPKTYTFVSPLFYSIPAQRYPGQIIPTQLWGYLLATVTRQNSSWNGAPPPPLTEITVASGSIARSRSGPITSKGKSPFTRTFADWQYVPADLMGPNYIIIPPVTRSINFRSRHSYCKAGVVSSFKMVLPIHFSWNR